MFPQRERPGQRTNPSGNPVATPPVCAVPGKAAPVATTDPSRPRSPGHGEPYRARRGHPEPSRHVRWGHPGLSRTQTPPSSLRPEPSRAPGRSADRDDPRRRRQRRRGLHTFQLDAGRRRAPTTGNPRPPRTPWATEFKRCSRGPRPPRGAGDSAVSAPPLGRPIPPWGLLPGMGIPTSWPGDFTRFRPIRVKYPQSRP